MSRDFEDLLESAFPRGTWPAIIRAQLEGIALADDVRRSTPMLNSLLGRDLRGHLRRIGVLDRTLHACKAGALPFEAEIGHMQHGTWHWLNIESGAFVAHIARTDEFREIPDDTLNRQALIVRNQYSLWDDRKLIPIRDLKAEVPRFYAYWTFGADEAGKLTHATLGMASHDNRVWLAQLDMLRDASGMLLPPPVPAPTPNPKDRLKLLDKFIETMPGEAGTKKK